MPDDTRPGDVLAARYRLTDLLTESKGGRFWRAFDFVLQRDVAVHIIGESDDRAPLLHEAARTSATVLDRRMLRVLDIDVTAGRCFVVNEWGSGTSLDILLATAGPLSPAVAAWIVAEVADTLTQAHEVGVAHGRLVPENVLVDHDGAVRLIGFAVDAALHGLPAGRTTTDIQDLVGLLYASLTGKWAGDSVSLVPRAPTTHGHVLRPRQVRAGIPRTLDSLCDHVLNRAGDAGVTADLVSSSLRDFLGDSAPAVAAWLALLEHPQDTGTVVLPQLPDPPVSDPDFASGPADPDDVDDVDAVDHADGPDGPPAENVPGTITQQSSIEDLPTQAGMPIFHDEADHVSWLARRAEPAPPPPPFDPPPPRPLFAPDPTDGEPVRRPRISAVPDRAGGGYWPWDEGPAASGSSLLAAVTEEDDDERRSPGSDMLRLAAIVGACLLLLIAIVIAYNLGHGKNALGQTPTTGTSGTPSSQTTTKPPKPAVLAGVSANDFDPQGVPPEENPTTVGNVVDHNPATTWQTSTYTENLGPAGLKTGLGLTLDLGAVKDVSELDLTLVGAPTRLQVFVTRTAPTKVAGLRPAGGTTATGTRAAIGLSPAVSGRFVTVWLTSLPAAPGGGFRGTIAEAVVKGD